MLTFSTFRNSSATSQGGFYIIISIVLDKSHDAIYGTYLNSEQYHYGGWYVSKISLISLMEFMFKFIANPFFLLEVCFWLFEFSKTNIRLKKARRLNEPRMISIKLHFPLIDAIGAIVEKELLRHIRDKFQIMILFSSSSRFSIPFFQHSAWERSNEANVQYVFWSRLLSTPEGNQGLK